MQPSQAGSNALFIAKCTEVAFDTFSIFKWPTLWGTISHCQHSCHVVAGKWQCRQTCSCVCVCVCQSKITGSVCGPMFGGLVSNVHWWHDVQQCVGPAVYIHTPVYTQCGSPPVSWWRRPAVRGRLLRNRIGTQYWILEEQKGKEKLVSIAIKNWPSARKMN